MSLKRDREGFLVPETPNKRQRVQSPEPEMDDDDELPDIDPSLLGDDEINQLLEDADDVSDFTSNSLRKVKTNNNKIIVVL